MREPKRLLSDGATDFERQLLNAVINERPSALMRSRMQQGLGIGGPITWAGSVAWASNAKALIGSVATKSVLSAAVGGVVAAGGLAAAVGLGALGGDPGSDSSAAPVAPVSAPVEAAPAPPAPLAVVPAEPSVAELEQDSQLRAEIARLDAARVALQQGARARALAELKHYDESFPNGILSREANLLRRQALSQKPHRSGRK